MKFSSIFTFVSLAFLGVEASPLSTGSKDGLATLERRLTAPQQNYQTLRAKGLPSNAQAPHLYAFEMKSVPKDDPSEYAGELNRVTTDNGGAHARLIVGYVSGEQAFTAYCYDIYSIGNIDAQHPNGNGLKVQPSKSSCSLSANPRSTITYLGQVANKELTALTPSSALSQIQTMGKITLDILSTYQLICMFRRHNGEHLGS